MYFNQFNILYLTIYRIHVKETHEYYRVEHIVINLT